MSTKMICSPGITLCNNPEIEENENKSKNPHCLLVSFFSRMNDKDFAQFAEFGDLQEFESIQSIDIADCENLANLSNSKNFFQSQPDSSYIFENIQLQNKFESIESVESTDDEEYLSASDTDSKFSFYPKSGYTKRQLESMGINDPPTTNNHWDSAYKNQTDATYNPGTVLGTTGALGLSGTTGKPCTETGLLSTPSTPVVQITPPVQTYTQTTQTTQATQTQNYNSYNYNHYGYNSTGYNYQNPTYTNPVPKMTTLHAEFLKLLEQTATTDADLNKQKNVCDELIKDSEKRLNYLQTLDNLDHFFDEMMDIQKWQVSLKSLLSSAERRLQCKNTLEHINNVTTRLQQVFEQLSHISTDVMVETFRDGTMVHNQALTELHLRPQDETLHSTIDTLQILLSSLEPRLPEPPIDQMPLPKQVLKITDMIKSQFLTSNNNQSVFNEDKKKVDSNKLIEQAKKIYKDAVEEMKKDSQVAQKPSLLDECNNLENLQASIERLERQIEIEKATQKIASDIKASIEQLSILTEDKYTQVYSAAFFNWCIGCVCLLENTITSHLSKDDSFVSNLTLLRDMISPPGESIGAIGTYKFIISVCDKCDRHQLQFDPFFVAWCFPLLDEIDSFVDAALFGCKDIRKLRFNASQQCRTFNAKMRKCLNNTNSPDAQLLSSIKNDLEYFLKLIDSLVHVSTPTEITIIDDMESLLLDLIELLEGTPTVEQMTPYHKRVDILFAKGRMQSSENPDFQKEVNVMYSRIGDCLDKLPPPPPPPPEPEMVPVVQNQNGTSTSQATSENAIVLYQGSEQNNDTVMADANVNTSSNNTSETLRKRNLKLKAFESKQALASLEFRKKLDNLNQQMESPSLCDVKNSVLELRGPIEDDIYTEHNCPYCLEHKNKNTEPSPKLELFQYHKNSPIYIAVTNYIGPFSCLSNVDQIPIEVVWPESPAPNLTHSITLIPTPDLPLLKICHHLLPKCNLRIVSGYKLATATFTAQNVIATHSAFAACVLDSQIDLAIRPKEEYFEICIKPSSIGAVRLVKLSPPTPQGICLPLKKPTDYTITPLQQIILPPIVPSPECGVCTFPDFYYYQYVDYGPVWLMYQKPFDGLLYHLTDENGCPLEVYSKRLKRFRNIKTKADRLGISESVLIDDDFDYSKFCFTTPVKVEFDDFKHCFSCMRFTHRIKQLPLNLKTVSFTIKNHQMYIQNSPVDFPVRVICSKPGSISSGHYQQPVPFPLSSLGCSCCKQLFTQYPPSYLNSPPLKFKLVPFHSRSVCAPFIVCILFSSGRLQELFDSSENLIYAKNNAIFDVDCDIVCVRTDDSKSVPLDAFQSSIVCPHIFSWINLRVDGYGKLLASWPTQPNVVFSFNVETYEYNQITRKSQWFTRSLYVSNNGNISCPVGSVSFIYESHI